MTPEVAAYLFDALDYIERQALRSGNMDWQTTRAEAMARIQDAHTTADTYPTLRWVLTRLGDHHSFLNSPQDEQNHLQGIVSSSGLRAVYPEGVIVDVHEHSPAALAGLHIRDAIEAINGIPRTQLDRASFYQALATSPVSLTCSRPSQESLVRATLHAASYQREMRPCGWQWEPAIGYLELPGVSGNQMRLKTYAQAAQQLIRSMDEASVRAWIIDLRRNGGGTMWAMLAGVSSLLGDGECGFFVSPTGTRESWLPTIEKRTHALLDEPYMLSHPAPAVAVLTSRLTASSGEFTLLAFIGRSRTHSFGEPTAGLPTANQNTTLPDGARLFLTVALGADRTGRTYESPIPPDHLITSDWTLFQTERDPVACAAAEWLRMQ